MPAESRLPELARTLGITLEGLGDLVRRQQARIAKIKQINLP